MDSTVSSEDFFRTVIPRESDKHEIDATDLHVHVTLTFAQSVDAKIAGKDGKQILLSGNESMIMTHRLRSMHDAILVGIGTALNDNPQLNTRLLPDGRANKNNPQPIILDSDLRFRLDSKLLLNYKAGTGKRPWVVSRARKSPNMRYQTRKSELEREGVLVVENASDDGGLSIPRLLSELRLLGIRSLMVEGGAKVITSFLQSSCVNTLIITIAPRMIGADGVTYSSFPLEKESNPLSFCASRTFGDDTVMMWTSPAASWET